jgi:carbamoyl-phosphate synthase small subunit
VRRGRVAHDAAYLFDRFIGLMEGTRDGRTANLSGEPVDAVRNPAAPHPTDNNTEDKK